jgi:hypothetical protein
MRTGSATKGAKDYNWAMIEITPDDTPEGQDPGHAVLLLRRRQCGRDAQAQQPPRERRHPDTTPCRVEHDHAACPDESTG